MFYILLVKYASKISTYLGVDGVQTEDVLFKEKAFPCSGSWLKLHGVPLLNGSFLPALTNRLPSSTLKKLTLIQSTIKANTMASGFRHIDCILL